MYKVNFKISLDFIQYLGAKKLPNPLKQQEILHKLVDEIDKIVGLRAGMENFRAYIIRIFFAIVSYR